MLRNYLVTHLKPGWRVGGFLHMSRGAAAPWAPQECWRLQGHIKVPRGILLMARVMEELQ